MSFPRYPECKESGVEWLGEVPAHWLTSRLRWHTKRYSGGTPDKQRPEYWEDGSIPWINSGAVNDGLIIQPSAYITEDAFRNSSAKWIPSGALVMALAGQGKTKGMVAQLGFETTCNQSMAALVPSGKLVARYVYWWLTSNYQNIRNMSGGDLRDGLNLELLGDIPCPIPPREEQQSIAEILDRETGMIDSLVIEQEKLIALLKEKRQAVISHAVTKGLDPNVPMKDSGIEWLGEVPAHWEIVPIKWLSSVQRGASPRPIDDPKFFDDNGEYAWVRISDVSSSNGYLFETDQRLSDTGSALSVRLLPGDLFISIAGTVGKPCISKIKACIHDGFVYFPRLAIDPEFLFRVFEAGTCYLGLGKFGTQLNLNTDTIGSIRVAMPPTEEIQGILKSIILETHRLDQLIDEANIGVALLQERRSTIISAAVTGKIDVRQYKAKEVA